MEKDEIQFRSAMDTAVRILTGRGHTASELARKLKVRRIKPDIVEQVVAECKRLHYIDDTDTAGRYLEELKRKGYGRRYVRNAMRKKGVTADIIEDILEGGYTDSEEKENAARLVRKKQATFNREKDRRKRKSKIYQYLYNRGFCPDVIRAVIHKSLR
jgi:regulatory protein